MLEDDSIHKNKIPTSQKSPVPLREQHGAVTRRAILTAARAAFADKGYAATSMKSLAESAGVAVQTIYSTFGSKAGVLAGMADLLDEEAGVVDLARAIPQASGGREVLALSVRLRRQIRERCGDIISMLRSGAAVDATARKTIAEGMRRRRMGIEIALRRIEEVGELRAGLPRERAAAIMTALVGDEVCDALVEEYGWSFDEYEAWLLDELAGALLDDQEVGDS
jgi:AcrR family transcriptional regulator